MPAVDIWLSCCGISIETDGALDLTTNTDILVNNTIKKHTHTHTHSSVRHNMIKLSVDETKWSSLLARTRALILYISI